MAQGLCHVLVHSVVLGVEDVTRGAPCVVGEACSGAREWSTVQFCHWAPLGTTCPTGMQLPHEFPVIPQNS